LSKVQYRRASQKIQKIFHRYTNTVEPLSLDEAYLDVTDCRQFQGSATRLAAQIRQDITQTTQLTASAGIAANKFLSKIASDWNKPNGQFSIPPHQVDQFIKTLPVKKIPGVGRVGAKKLYQLGIDTCAQLQTVSESQLTNLFGKFGKTLYHYSRGIDHRCVDPSRIRQSVSVERTFPHDLNVLTDCELQLVDLYNDLYTRLQKHTHRIIAKQFIKVKFFNFTQITKECVVTGLSHDLFIRLLRMAMAENKKPVRLLGVGVRFKDHDASQQHVLFQ